MGKPSQVYDYYYYCTIIIIIITYMYLYILFAFGEVQNIYAEKKGTRTIEKIYDSDILLLIMCI